jgi:hypothetical protein
MKRIMVCALVVAGVIVLVPAAAGLAGRFVKTFFRFVTGFAGEQREVMSTP